MRTDSRLQVQLLIQNGLFAVLLCAAAFLIVWLLRNNHLQWDMTQNQRNTLTRATIDVLSKMQGPITVTAYAKPRDATEVDVWQQIREFIQPYQRVKPDVTLKFVNPDTNPKEARAADIRSNGELVIEYGKRSEHLTMRSEQNMANLLQRLARSQERVIAYLDGHGEPKLDGRANFDLGEFGRQLGTKGFRVQPINLALAQDMPANINVLIVATPRVDVLKGEAEKLKRYVDAGGNLLWLLDQEPMHGLQPLSEALGLQLTPGVVVDPASSQLRIPPTIALAASYGMHAITENFNLNTAFPFVRQIATKPENPGWRATPLVEVAQRGWLEIGDVQKDMQFDKDREVHGPVVIAVALERSVKDKSQRVVVVGGSQFLSNQYVGLLSNLDLGTNMLNWLSEDENLITLQPRARVDSQLNLDRSGLAIISVGFLLLMPAVFLFTGGFIWWRRRRN